MQSSPLLQELGRSLGFAACAKDQTGFWAKQRNDLQRIGYCKGSIHKFSSFLLQFVSANWKEKDVVSQGTAQDFPALLVELVGGQLLVEDKLNMSQWCVLVAEKAKYVWGCISKRVASRLRKWSFPLFSIHKAYGALCPGLGPQYNAGTGEDAEEGHQDGYRSGVHHSVHHIQREAEVPGLVQPRSGESGGNLTAVFSDQKKGNNREDSQTPLINAQLMEKKQQTQVAIRNI